MFGMAMKFLELGLEPIFKTNGPGENQTTSQNSNPQQNVVQKKPTAKSTQIIKPSSENGIPNTQNDYENQIAFSAVSMQELRQSQQKVLQDFKRSIQRSIAFSNHQQPRTKVQQPSGQQPQYDLVEGIVLSKIQQLSEEYLEYSLRKQFTSYHLNQKPKTGSLSLESAHNQNSVNNKSSSCEFIKSIVKSVLLPQSITITQMSNKLSFQNIHLKQSSVKRSQNKIPQINLQTNNLNLQSKNSLKSSSQISKQPVTEFIKQLFESLGLIEKNQNNMSASCSLKQMTQTARKKFNSLRGNDYVEKLNEMLQSVEGINYQQGNASNQIPQQDGKIKHSIGKGSSSAPIVTSQYYTVPISDSSSQPKQQQQRKQILVKRRSVDKKVKLVSPQTLSQLKSKHILIEKQITDALQFLTLSRRVKKFSFHSKDINEVVLNFSYDFQFMSYKRVTKGFFSQANLMSFVKILCDCTRNADKNTEQSKQQQKQTSMIPLKWNLVNIAKGLKTKNFIKFQQILQSKKQSKQTLHEDRCFSLLFKNRTYDFQCESKAIRDEYFRTIKIMIKSTCEV